MSTQMPKAVMQPLIDIKIYVTFPLYRLYAAALTMRDFS